MKVKISLEEIQTIVGLQLGIKNVRPEDHLLSDLGAESADILNIIAGVEDRCKIRIPEKDITGLDTAVRIWTYIKESGEFG